MAAIQEQEKYEIKLTLEELLLIDGKCNEKAQKVVDDSKMATGWNFELKVMSDILLYSIKTGIFKKTYKRISSCSYCDKKPEYQKYKRSGRYHRKGQSNYDKPITHSGVKYNEGFVTIQNYGDMCCDCDEKYKVTEKIIEKIISNDLQIEIKISGEKSKYKKYDVKECFDCGKEITENEMGRSNAFISGTYPSTCPHCGAKSTVFGKSHNYTNKHIMVRVAE